MEGALEPAEQGLVEILGYAEQVTIVIVVRGEIDSQTVPTLGAALTAAISRPAARCVVLDLEEVVFFGSAGIAFLTKADGEARAHAVELRLVVDRTGRVHRVLDMMGLAQLVPLYPTRAEALMQR
ncbi:MAG: STAS domain-containing protein [Actinomycetota bacterium]|nr:STAS domain-containing protein [Actinomycetota bacterium]